MKHRQPAVLIADLAEGITADRRLAVRGRQVVRGVPSAPRHPAHRHGDRAVLQLRPVPRTCAPRACCSKGDVDLELLIVDDASTDHTPAGHEAIGRSRSPGHRRPQRDQQGPAPVDERRAGAGSDGIRGEAGCRRPAATGIAGAIVGTDGELSRGHVQLWASVALHRRDPANPGAADQELDGRDGLGWSPAPPGRDQRDQPAGGSDADGRGSPGRSDPRGPEAHLRSAPVAATVADRRCGTSERANRRLLPGARGKPAAHRTCRGDDRPQGPAESFDAVLDASRDPMGDAEPLRDSAHRALAATALDAACRGYDRPHSRPAPPADLIRFALQVYPQARSLPEWRHRCRIAVGPERAPKSPNSCSTPRRAAAGDPGYLAMAAIR